MPFSDYHHIRAAFPCLHNGNSKNNNKSKWVNRTSSGLSCVKYHQSAILLLKDLKQECESSANQSDAALSWNELQLLVFSRAHHFISVPGGLQYLSSYFGVNSGSSSGACTGTQASCNTSKGKHIVLHKRGSEYVVQNQSNTSSNRVVLNNAYERVVQHLSGSNIVVAHNEEDLLVKVEAMVTQN